ncbi:MAG: class I SAM-dependent methyltransferase [Defluviitaleaceae bacterium]|nr:class I SAM-dependent methyltransferase [Defluviitaleaceae bacterium]
MNNKLKTHYEENYEEDGRLWRSNGHKIEFLTTIHYFDKLLPKGGRILDVCAGTGEYAFYLANKGYDVFACDLLDKHVNIMKAKPYADKLEGIEAANALDLSRFDEGSFDIVLCMGALYHIFDPLEREKCVAECLRVLKTNGIFVFAYINRNGAYIADLGREDGYKVRDLIQVIKTGKSGVFYGMDFGEADALVTKFPLTKIVDIGTNGLRYPLADWINSADEDEFDAYMEYHLATCEQPSIIGHSPNALWIGKKV